MLGLRIVLLSAPNPLASIMVLIGPHRAAAPLPHIILRRSSEKGQREQHTGGSAGYSQKVLV
jgi:hypothetical protein